MGHTPRIVREYFPACSAIPGFHADACPSEQGKQMPETGMVAAVALKTRWWKQAGFVLLRFAVIPCRPVLENEVGLGGLIGCRTGRG
ncbi:MULTISPECIES: hypothetical protein [unclassified Neisseria]|uniref:hypothetical protein n=1 Tax=unclassified Neisseria TaxID=2623750 RepID=UPI001072ACFB|nr:MULTISPECIES: hypothetical protein [unclassified Neisseria]MBF0804560.1 hypothetical protein [Neisseria sp. 19428wB4_WF04]TFU40416.1 hypothetical protein E4T99_09430 [Neisseria sp. WF04]